MQIGIIKGPSGGSPERNSMRIVRLALVAATLLVLMPTCPVVCQSKGKDAPDGKANEKDKKAEAKDEVKTLELPWTAEQLKKAVKKGRKHKYKDVFSGAGSEETKWYVEEVIEVTDEGFKERTAEVDSKGKETGNNWEIDRKWSAYLGDESFTSENTKTSEEKIRVGAGEYSCKVFERTQTDKDEIKTVLKWYFSKDKPGLIPRRTSETELIPGFKTSHVCELQEIS